MSIVKMEKMTFYRDRAEFSLSECDGAPWRGIQRSLRHPIGDRTVSDRYHRYPSITYTRVYFYLLLTNEQTYGAKNVRA